MSLINEVLNDLEMRGVNTGIGDNTIKVVPLTKGNGMLWLRLIAFVMLLVAAVSWLKWVTAPSSNTAPQAKVEPLLPVVDKTEMPQVVIQQVGKPVMELNKGTGQETLSNKPNLTVYPVIQGVSPTQITSKKGIQKITIIGSGFEKGATVTLYSPNGRAYTNRKIISWSTTEIVIEVNLHKAEGLWNIEVFNPSHFAEGKKRVEKLTSGKYKLLVQSESEVHSALVKKKAALPLVKASLQSSTNAFKVNFPVGISKHPTQITQQQQADHEFRKAYSLMLLGQIGAAIYGCEIALNLDAGHTLARETLVRMLLDSKRNTDAERILQDGLQYDVRQTSLAMLLARLQVTRNELAQALDTMQKSLIYAKNQADYQAFIAALFQRQSRHGEAIVYFENAVKLNSQSGVWLMGLGISLRAEERNDDARDAFKRALATNKLNADLNSYVSQQLKEL